MNEVDFIPQKPGEGNRKSRLILLHDGGEKVKASAVYDLAKSLTPPSVRHEVANALLDNGQGRFRAEDAG